MTNISRSAAPGHTVLCPDGAMRSVLTAVSHVRVHWGELPCSPNQVGPKVQSQLHIEGQEVMGSTCLVICAPTPTHTHTHTHARTHFDIGKGTIGLPSLQTLVGWGVFAFVTHFLGGGGASELPWGRVELGCVGGCSFLCFTGAFCQSNMNQFQI